MWTQQPIGTTYSKSSLARLASCHEDIQSIFFSLAEKGWDITVLCGHRTESEQTAAFTQGLSKAQWPNSSHNHLESRAIDAGPHIPGLGVPFHEGDGVWCYFAGVVLLEAQAQGIALEWGGFYSGLKDMNHFELI